MDKDETNLAVRTVEMYLAATADLDAARSLVGHARAARLSGEKGEIEFLKSASRHAERLIAVLKEMGA